MKKSKIAAINSRSLSRSYQTGVVLLEALIAILIFSMGVLALVGLQATMIKNTANSQYRAEASNIAQQRIGLMWSDPVNTALGAYNELNTDISAQLPGGTRTVNQPDLNLPEYIVSVTWWPPGEPQQHRLTTIATISGG